VRVVVADDAALFREGLVAILAGSGFEIAGQYAMADELVAAVETDSPDVVLVDVRMPPTHTDEGLRGAVAIRETNPNVGVLVLSQYAEVGVALELLLENAAGVGYLLKDRVADAKELADAVTRVGRGGSALDPTIVDTLIARRRGDDPMKALTPREREVLGLMAEGRSNQGIAERMDVSERAVKKHITSIFEKLGLGADEDDHRRVLAVLAYLRP
jgi:DNA-binding NarL/FixJ family response regulator